MGCCHGAAPARPARWARPADRRQRRQSSNRPAPHLPSGGSLSSRSVSQPAASLQQLCCTGFRWPAADRQSGISRIPDLANWSGCRSGRPVRSPIAPSPSGVDSAPAPQRQCRSSLPGWSGLTLEPDHRAAMRSALVPVCRISASELDSSVRRCLAVHQPQEHSARDGSADEGLPPGAIGWSGGLMPLARMAAWTAGADGWADGLGRCACLPFWVSVPSRGRCAGRASCCRLPASLGPSRLSG